MLYKDNLEEIIFGRHEVVESDELIVCSGYLGPSPVERLGKLPIQSKVIYGMYGSEGIKLPLHRALKTLQESIPSVDIFYSLVPIHSKAYVWRLKGRVVHSLVGSANFSTNGLSTPYREILAETTVDTFGPLNDYLAYVLDRSQSCLEAVKVVKAATTVSEVPVSQDVCTMTLLDPRTGEVPPRSGLNWGQNSGQVHTTPNDAYIPIRASHVRNFPTLFPPKQLYSVHAGGRSRRHNDSVEIIWDDGYHMKALFEGNLDTRDGIFPKGISSFPAKSELGKYMRQRLGVPPGQPVRRYHLERYGRTDVAVSLLAEGVYEFDFSRK